MSALNRDESSTESQQDFSDELNESAYYHSFFNKEDLEENLSIHNSGNIIPQSRMTTEEHKEENK